MKLHRLLLIATLIAALSCTNKSVAANTNSTTTPTDSIDHNGETATTKAARMQWFSDAKLGIFIHWGIYAVDGVAESWSFYNERMTHEQYMKQCKGFTASKYDPAYWVKLIKESGAKYTVITSKHHDGVALWKTKTKGLNTAKHTAAARDVLTPFTQEVRKQGLKLGLYYSLIDWSHNDYPGFTRTKNRYKVEDDPARWQRFCTFNNAEMKEINTLYYPDLIWFDGDWEHNAETWDAPGIVKMLRADNPNVIINSRIQGYGDYLTPEQGVPVVRPEGKYWELCLTMNDSWGYDPEDTNYKTPHICLTTFVDCLSNGGNLLLDIGPSEDGTIAPKQVAILEAFARWTSKHAEAIYGTRAGIPKEHFQGYTTLNKAGDILYLYFPYRPNENVELKGIVNDVEKVWVVGNNTELEWKLFNKRSWSEVPGNLYINVPDNVLDSEITVVAVKLKGPIQLYRGAGKVIEWNE